MLVGANKLLRHASHSAATPPSRQAAHEFTSLMSQCESQTTHPTQDASVKRLVGLQALRLRNMSLCRCARIGLAIECEVHVALRVKNPQQQIHTHTLVVYLRIERPLESYFSQPSCGCAPQYRADMAPPGTHMVINVVRSFPEVNEHRPA